MLTNWTLTWCIWHQLNLTCISKRENLVQHIERSLHRLLVISPAERWHWEGARAGTPGSYWGQSQREGAGSPEGPIRTDQRDRPRKGTAQEGGGHPAFQSSNVWHGEVLCRNTGVWKNTCSYHVWVSLSCDHCLSKSVWNVTVHVLLILGIILLDGFFPPLWSLQAVFFFFPTTVFVFALQVRSSDATWSDTRRNLRKDHRWESASLLEREEKEKLFNEHVEALAKKKKEHFRQLLDETSMVRSEKTGQKKVPEVILYAIFIIRYIW